MVGRLHALAALPHGERDPDTHWIGCCGGPIASLEAVAKCVPFLPVPGSNLCPPALRLVTVLTQISRLMYKHTHIRYCRMTCGYI
jgi:hypothetical protein